MLDTSILNVLAEPEAVQQARVFTAKNLAKWGMADLTDDAVLVVSELVTNAVNASSGAVISVWIAADGWNLVIEVWDPAPGIPVLIRPSAEDDGGRGLAVVEAVSKDWGVRPVTTGKVAWAHLVPAQEG